MMTVGSLFSGIGGLDLGLERAGMVIRFQVEIDPFCNKVLEKHWPGVKRYGDIKGIDWGQAERVECICGGFPCPPVSCAGKRKGNEDERWLWPEFERCIRGIRPEWVIIENVRGLLSSNSGREFTEVLRSLSANGYDAQCGIVSASDVGAPHRRERIFILGHSQHCGRGTFWSDYQLRRSGAYSGAGEQLANPRRIGLRRLQPIGQSQCGEEASPGEESERLAHPERGTRPSRQGECGIFGGKGTERIQSLNGGPGEGLGNPAGKGGCGSDKPRSGKFPGGGDSELENPDHTGHKAWDVGTLNAEGKPIQAMPGASSYEIPPWPPGPDEREKWAEILRRWPELAPALPHPKKGKVRQTGISPRFGNACGISTESEVRRMVDGIPAGLDKPEPCPEIKGRWHVSEMCVNEEGLKAYIEMQCFESLNPLRVQRLKALGNAVVPAVAELVGRLIMECEAEEKL